MATISGVAFIALVVVCTPAAAQPSVTTIAALGASQTYGKGSLVSKPTPPNSNVC